MFSLRAFLHRTLPTIWQRRGWAARLLWPLSRLYAWGWHRHQRQAAQAAAQAPTPALPVPVLVIGNVVAGGAGKTPTCIAVVQHFQSQGVRVGVLSRGYGRQASAPACLAIDWHTPPEHAGDEPLLIHRHTGAPVVVCAQRLQAAQHLLQQHPDTQLLVCDDGLQHLALPRDGEICVMDERGIGNGWLLPAGPLREPWPRRSTVLLQIASPHTTAATLPIPPGQVAYRAQRTLADSALRADGQRQSLAGWVQSGQAIAALAGIAQPERFFNMLRAAGLHVANTAALPDHASSDELLLHAQSLLAQDLPVLCTEKDAVKLWSHLPQLPQTPQLWAVPLVLQTEPGFFAALDDWWQQQQAQHHRPVAGSAAP